MSLIQDVGPQPRQSGKSHNNAAMPAVRQIQQLHQATIIHKPAGSPQSNRYSSFRPHPLLVRPADDTTSAPKPAVLQKVAPQSREPASAEANPPMARQQSAASLNPAFPAQAQATAAALNQPLALLGQTETPAQNRKSFGGRLLEFIQYPLIAIAALGAAYIPFVGHILVGIYLLAAFTFRIPSRTSFAIGIVLLLCMPIFWVLHIAGVTHNISIYAYEMLAIGAVQAWTELLKENRRHKSTI